MKKRKAVWVHRYSAALLALALSSSAQVQAEDTGLALPLESYAAQSPAWHGLDDGLALDDEGLSGITARGVGGNGQATAAEEIAVILWDEGGHVRHPSGLSISDGGLNTQATTLQAQRP